MIFVLSYDISGMSKASKKEKRMDQPRLGRPPSEGSTMGKPFMLRLPEDLQAEIEDVAADLPDRKERSFAIRMLLREALAARGRRK